MSAGTPQGEARDVVLADRLVGPEWSDILTTMLSTDDPCSIGASYPMVSVWHYGGRSAQLAPRLKVARTWDSVICPLILHHIVLFQRGQARRSDERAATPLVAVFIYDLWLGKPHTNPTTSTRPTQPRSHMMIRKSASATGMRGTACTCRY